MKKRKINNAAPASNLIPLLVFFVISIIPAGSCAYTPQSVVGKKSDSTFALFAFDNYMVAGDYKQSQVRADTLKELGYDGIGNQRGHAGREFLDSPLPDRANSQAKEQSSKLN